MTDFSDLAELVTGASHALLGEGLAVVTSADGLVVASDVNVVVEEDAAVETANGTTIYGQTVISFDKADLGGITITKDVSVELASGKIYAVRTVQTEDAWAVTAVVV